ncbi:MAG: alpha/beta hydrolase [Parafilimonas sp.]|nr:alpha/beta hydrolase [Parafilimonas sp.]
MKLLHTCLPAAVLMFTASMLNGQNFPVQKLFPEGTFFYQNIPYANDTSQKHLLDIYLPRNTKNYLSLVVWIHGGAWMLNDKYADMSYMKNTVRSFIDSGYALASINYRYSTDSVFPAQIRDCNQAIEFLYQHASDYHIDKNKIAVIGFSAGGHLASLLALSNNNSVSAFLNAPVHFKIKVALDFYGPSDFVMLASNPDTLINNMRNPVSILLGDLPVNRPDIAKMASPVTYVDKNDPPFLIVQGEKDESVPNTQSRILHAWLTLNDIKNDLIIVPGAPHYGEMFDADYIRNKLFEYLRNYLK